MLTAIDLNKAVSRLSRERRNLLVARWRRITGTSEVTDFRQVSVQVQDAPAKCNVDRCSPIGYVELAQDAADVRLDRFFRNAQ